MLISIVFDDWQKGCLSLQYVKGWHVVNQNILYRGSSRECMPTCVTLYKNLNVQQSTSWENNKEEVNFCKVPIIFIYLVYGKLIF